MAKNKHNMNVGSTIDRSDERIKETQEVFTPMELVESMVNDIDIELLQDPESTFIDNSAGCGNFLIALKKKLLEYHTEEHILNHMLYAVEMMEDNHKELCSNLGVDVTHPHYVCADALEYDYSFNEEVGLEDHGLGKIPKPKDYTPPTPNTDPSEASLDKFL